MKTRSLIYVVLLVVFSFVSCKEEAKVGGPDGPEIVVSPEDEAWQYRHQPNQTKSRNFISDYIIDVNAIKIYQNSFSVSHDFPITDQDWSEKEWLAVNVDFYISTKDADCTKDKYNGVAIYDKLATKNKDISYNDYFWDSTPYFSEPAQAINMICNTDYDAQHPANTPLNDIVEIKYFTAKPFLASRYKNRRLGDMYNSCEFEPLSVFNSKGVSLVRDDIRFRLDKNPEKAGIYSFTITYVDSQGKEYSATSKPTRLKAREN